MHLVVLINGLLAGTIAASGPLLAALADKGELTHASVYVAAIVGFVAFAKDIQSRLSEPPK